MKMLKRRAPPFSLVITPIVLFIGGIILFGFSAWNHNIQEFWASGVIEGVSLGMFACLYLAQHFFAAFGIIELETKQD